MMKIKYLFGSSLTHINLILFFEIGPLMQLDAKSNKATLIGVVSFGYACGRIEFPAIYTRVSNYLPWIKKVLRQY